MMYYDAVAVYYRITQT